MTEQNRHKRPNKIVTNDRTKSPQMTEKFPKDLRNSQIISRFAAENAIINNRQDENRL